MSSENHKGTPRVPTKPAKPQARKRFGQHFLERTWIAKILNCIRPGASEFFLEVGPGCGELTLPLATIGAKIIAIEIDRRLAENLRHRVPPSVQIVTGDVLHQDLHQLIRQSGVERPANIRVVGNLPYNLSTPILNKLLEAQQMHLCFSDATLMLQREVADRVTGVPGSPTYGPLALMTQVLAEAELVLALPPGAFRPAPKVHSGLVKLSFRPSPVTIHDLSLFRRLIRSLFTQRRKTVLNAFRVFASTVSSLPPQELLDRSGIKHTARPGTLDLFDYARLTAVLSGHTVSSSSIDST